MARDGGARKLSLTEARVAQLIAEGRSDEQIAARLGIEVGDVGAELASALRKLGLRSRTELAFLVPDQPRDERRDDR